MVENNKNNGNNVKVRWIYLVIGAVTATTGFLFWLQGKLDAKADISMVKEVMVKQERQDDILVDIRQRLIRIETKLESK